MPPSWNCCRLYLESKFGTSFHVRWGSTGRVHRPVISGEDHRAAALLLPGLSYSPFQLLHKSLWRTVSKVEKGKSAAVTARDSLIWELPSR